MSDSLLVKERSYRPAPRHACLASTSSTHHNSDNNRQVCFFEPDDYLFYLDCLKTAAGNAGCDVHAYVLMTNHVHILATPRRDHATPLQSIGPRYVQYVNKRNERTGTLGEGRYRASLVDAELYLLTCYRGSIPMARRWQ